MLEPLIDAAVPKRSLQSESAIRPQAYPGPPPRDIQLRLSASSLTIGEGYSLVPDKGFPVYYG